MRNGLDKEVCFDAAHGDGLREAPLVWRTDFPAETKGAFYEKKSVRHRHRAAKSQRE